MSPQPRTPGGQLLRRLLDERGVDRHALFLLQQEGKELPGGVESLSGFVLLPDGRVFGFWLDWDRSSGKFVLDPWYPVHDPSEFEGDPEYRRARSELARGA